MLCAFFWVIPRRLTPGNYPEENTQHTEYGESLKSRKYVFWQIAKDFLSLEQITEF